MKAAFLDRDGVINEDYGYVHKWKDFKFCDGAIEGLNLLKSLDYLLIIITNQSGIDRGFFSELEYQRLTEKYTKQLSKNGLNIDAIYHCPHHPNYSELKFKDCNCRKPKPGMIFKAVKEFNINLTKSIIIGDSERDIEAGKNAGIKQRFLISSQKIFKNDNILFTKSFPSLIECAKYISLRKK